MTARLLAFVIWAAVAATVVFWGLRLFVRQEAAPAHGVVSVAPSAQGADLTRVLGRAPASAAVPEAASSRFRLLGVVAPRQNGAGKTGVALIQVDDKPARAFRVGATVDEGLIVQSVQRRGVSLGASGEPPQLQLELPPPPTAATGSLPPPTSLLPPPPSGAAPPSQGLPRRPPPVAPPAMPPQQQGVPLQSQRMPPQRAAPAAPQEAPTVAPSEPATTVPIQVMPPQPGQQTSPQRQ